MKNIADTKMFANNYVTFWMIIRTFALFDRQIEKWAETLAGVVSPVFFLFHFKPPLFKRIARDSETISSWVFKRPASIQEESSALEK